MRFLPRVFLGVLVALFFFPSLAHAQWSGTGPVYTNDNVGIGTSNPNYTLDLHGNVEFQHSGGDQNSYYFRISDSGGVRYDARNGEGDVEWLMDWGNKFLIDGGAEPGDTVFRINEDSDFPVFHVDGSAKVGIGTASPSERLSVNGTVRSKEVIVDNSNWPDFVFEPGYDLRSLDAVDAFVDANGHLPDVPSAADIEHDGQHVGATQATLLQKIEELTLYAIDRNDDVQALKTATQTLQSQNEQLRSQNEQLRSLLQSERARNDRQQKQMNDLKEAVQRLLERNSQ